MKGFWHRNRNFLLWVVGIVLVTLNVVQWWVNDLMRGVARDARARTVAQCQAHRDALSVVGRQSFTADDLSRLRSLGLKIVVGSAGNYIGSSLSGSETCVKSTQAADLTVSFPDACASTVPGTEDP